MLSRALWSSKRDNPFTSVLVYEVITSLPNPIHLQSRKLIFWTGLISPFTNLLCNSHQYFSCSCNCVWFNIRFSLFHAFTVFYEITVSIMSSFHSTLCFLCVSDLMCLLVLPDIFIWRFHFHFESHMTGHNSQFHFLAKMTKIKWLKKNIFSSLLTVTRQTFLCMS